jgi:hypothetical protein
MDSHENNSHRPPVPTREQLQGRARASAHREALSRRARRIRRSVASLAAVLFSTAFLVIYVQLASGHDPALVANAKRAASASTTSGSSKTATTSTGTGSSTTESTPTTSGESSTGSSSSSSEESSSGASAVTTSQS